MSPGASGLRAPPESGKSLEKVSKRSRKDFFETFSRLSGGPRPEAPGDVFQTFSGFRARRARETPCKWPTRSQGSVWAENPTSKMSIRSCLLAGLRLSQHQCSEMFLGMAIRNKSDRIHKIPENVRARQRSGEGVVRRNGCPKGCFWRVRFFSAPLRFALKTPERS